MNETFIDTQYLADLGNNPVSEFAKAGRATQSVAVGTARKVSEKNKLCSVLSASVGVESRFVSDSYGRTSEYRTVQLTSRAAATIFMSHRKIDSSNRF